MSFGEVQLQPGSIISEIASIGGFLLSIVAMILAARAKGAAIREVVQRNRMFQAALDIDWTINLARLWQAETGRRQWNTLRDGVREGIADILQNQWLSALERTQLRRSISLLRRMERNGAADEHHVRRIIDELIVLRRRLINAAMEN